MKFLLFLLILLFFLLIYFIRLYFGKIIGLFLYDDKMVLGIDIFLLFRIKLGIKLMFICFRVLFWIFKFIVGGFDFFVIWYICVVFLINEKVWKVLLMRDLKICFCKVLVLMRYVLNFILNMFVFFRFGNLLICVIFIIFSCIWFGRYWLEMFCRWIFFRIRFLIVNGIMVLNLFGVMIFIFCFVFVCWIKLFWIFSFLKCNWVWFLRLLRIIFNILFVMK